MKFVGSVPFFVCSLLGAVGIVAVANSIAGSPAVVALAASQDSAPEAPTLSGSWQMSWTNANGAQREVAMQIKQDGTRLSGKFEGERGAVPLSGSLDGSQVSFSVKLRRRDVSFKGTVDGDKMSGSGEQGGSWTAIRQPH
jgi:hypothetical protein